jgi:hypothetical protein
MTPRIYRRARGGAAVRGISAGISAGSSACLVRLLDLAIASGVHYKPGFH